MDADNKKMLFVTGGLGFIGSHFIGMALERGYGVINIDKITYASYTRLNGYFQGKFPGRYSFIKKDINDLKMLPDCDYIVHFAAESHVDNAIRDANIFAKCNVFGTLNLLNLAVARKKAGEKVPIFLYISTDEVFGDRKDGFFREDDSLNPSNPYAASKAAAEMFVCAYGRTYGLPYQITRTTNNYGDHQHPEKLIPRCILSILKDEKITIHGSGNQVRNWIHVKDNCCAIFDVMEKGKLNHIYHISSPDELSVNQIVEKIIACFNKTFSQDLVEHVEDRSGQDVRYALDSARISGLGWVPQYTVDDHLHRVVADYKVKYAKKVWPKFLSV